MLDQDSPKIGRFDKSFLIHMIRDFFIILVIVTIVEFAIKAGLVLYDYQLHGEDQAADVAEDLADNVRSIMRNEGGPVAARTMYPILDRNWTALGYEIAIEPAPVTIASIEQGFGFTPEGIPADDWSGGRFREAAVAVTAEPFCLACHTEARTGDTLGTITVRTYLYRDFLLWWEDVQLTAAFAVGKIVLHSFLLFLILRARMEPLLELRSVVSNLARAYGRLDHRAEIRTADEFGVLARDLNLFLDRITRVVRELEGVLSKVVSVNDSIIDIQADLKASIRNLSRGLRDLERDAMLSAKKEPRLSDEWFDAMRRSVGDLDAAVGGSSRRADAADILDALRQVVRNAEAQIATSERMYAKLATISEQSDELQTSMTEMSRLEERLKGIIETCGTLVGRLQVGNRHREENR